MGTGGIERGVDSGTGSTEGGIVGGTWYHFILDI